MVVRSSGITCDTPAAAPDRFEYRSEFREAKCSRDDRPDRSGGPGIGVNMPCCPCYSQLVIVILDGNGDL